MKQIKPINKTKFITNRISVSFNFVPSLWAFGFQIDLFLHEIEFRLGPFHLGIEDWGPREIKLGLDKENISDV